jgi:hypothetical protein
MINFALCFMICKAHAWGTFSQIARLESTITLSYAPYFENDPHPMTLPYTSDTPGRWILGTNTNYLTLYPKFVARLAGEDCFFFFFFPIS